MTLSKKTKQTNKKFYGKWLYKVSVDIPGCSLLRTETAENLELFCQGENPEKNYYSTWQRAYANRENILKLCGFLKAQTDHSIRIESSSLDFYTNDKSVYENASTTFEDLIVHRFEPTDETIDLLNTNSNFIVVDKLPKGRYNYRVYLLPHKMKGDKEGKEKYLTWLKGQTPKVTCTPAIEKWFLNTEWNWDRRYILVEDEATLLMLKLRNSEVVGRIYNFVISDK